MREKKDNKRFTFFLPIGLRDRIDNYVARTGTNITAIIVMAVNEWLDKKEREATQP